MYALHGVDVSASVWTQSLCVVGSTVAFINGGGLWVIDGGFQRKPPALRVREALFMCAGPTGTKTVFCLYGLRKPAYLTNNSLGCVMTYTLDQVSLDTGFSRLKQYSENGHSVSNTAVGMVCNGAVLVTAFRSDASLKVNGFDAVTFEVLWRKTYDFAFFGHIATLRMSLEPIVVVSGNKRCKTLDVYTGDESRTDDHFFADTLVSPRDMDLYFREHVATCSFMHRSPTYMAMYKWASITIRRSLELRFAWIPTIVSTSI
jgi:hypothetical protein